MIQMHEIDPENIYVMIMDKKELSDLIQVVEWFARTEAELYLQNKWQTLLSDLRDVKRQQQSYSGEELERLDKEELR